MAISIKSIPTLKDKTAESFVRTISKNESTRGSIDFKSQFAATNKILNKAKI